MPFGHGPFDYVVVAIVTIWTVRLLIVSPHRLLLWLPTFLTIDFFIPLGTQLTPSRILPLIIGVWLLQRGWLNPVRAQAPYVLSIAAVLGASVMYALLAGDAGTRPVFRALHYLGLGFVFLFVYRAATKEDHIGLILWGFVLAGLVHGLHSIYQVIAFNTGLPFRAIVYSATGFAAPVTEFGLRVNGLADEPKRLGYILFAAVIALGYLGLSRQKTFKALPLGKWSRAFQWLPLLALTVGALLSISLLTFSGSYIAAVGIVVIVLALTFSARMIALGGLALVGLFAASLYTPETVTGYQQTFMRLTESRLVEFDQGLDANKVYRQEFFAQELVNDDPFLLVHGVGLGRYNIVFYRAFGAGAGYGAFGSIAPLNSQLYEVGFDLGLPGLLLMYVGGLALVARTGRATALAYALSTILLFLIVQSLFIENKMYLSYAAAGCATLLKFRRQRLVTRARRMPRTRPLTAARPTTGMR